VATLSEGKRPGGLTALGVLNIILGVLGMLSTGAWFALLAVLGEGESAELDEARQELQPMLDAVEQMGQGVFVAWVVVSVVSSLLLLVAGVGYLKQKRFLGRTLGNAYAVLAIVTAIIGAATAPVELGGGFGIGNIIGLVYPLITLYCINIVVKDDLVR
jgi:hypothetical protein